MLSLLHVAAGQVQRWAQCGGIEWSGPTDCGTSLRPFGLRVRDLRRDPHLVVGTSCTRIHKNYFQCVPNSGRISARATPTASVCKPPGTTSTVTSSAPTGINTIPPSMLTEITNFGENPSNISMFVYRPQVVAPNPPLVVASHCMSLYISSLANTSINFR